MLGFLDFDEVCGLDVLSRSAEEWAMVVQVYLKAVGLWKVLIPPGMLWSVVRLLEGAQDRVRGPRFDGQPASRVCHRHGAIQELRESLGPW